MEAPGGRCPSSRAYYWRRCLLDSPHIPRGDPRISVVAVVAAVVVVAVVAVVAMATAASLSAGVERAPLLSIFEGGGMQRPLGHECL